MPSFRIPLILVKIFRYEFWTWWAFYLPPLVYWAWLSIRNRSFMHFTAVNPAIPASGFFGESKQQIIDLIDPKYLPKSFFVPAETTYDQLLEQLVEQGLDAPFVVKPNVGERGDRVVKVCEPDELRAYVGTGLAQDCIIQEYVESLLEFGVLYTRRPGEEKGRVTSVTQKEFLHVRGDGYATVRELLAGNLRARMAWGELEGRLGDTWKRVPRKGKTECVQPIGNHCLGTKFLNANDLIDDRLEAVFNEIAAAIPGFHYGRFDVRVDSLRDLYGGNIRILELNGVSSEPGHIYDPSYTLLRAYRDVFRHFRLVSEIGMENVARGVVPWSFKTLFQSTREHFGGARPRAETTTAAPTRPATGR